MSFDRALLRTLVLLLAVACPAQAPGPLESGITLRKTTRLVLVDAVVTDSQGKAVAGLKGEDFTILEDGRPQTISSFSFEDGASAQLPAPAPPTLPPGVFSNAGVTGMRHVTPTVLLIDFLNTPWESRGYALDEVRRYLRSVDAFHPLALFALTDRLHLLQDLTGDPKLLLAALDSRSLSAAGGRSESAEPEGPVAPGPRRVQGKNGRAPAAAGHGARSPGELSGRDRRYDDTLGALRFIGRWAARYPGRKSLLWLSAAFPIHLFPRIGLPPHPGPQVTDDLRRTASVLTDASVAVYPIDARGLISRGGTFYAEDNLEEPISGELIGAEMQARTAEITASFNTMDELAQETGGTAFYNRNDLGHGMGESVREGSTYYLLGYYPRNPDWNGGFRRIQMKLARPGLRLRYRRGYYAIDPERNVQVDAHARLAEFAAALEYEAPPSSALPLQVRLEPAASDATLVLTYSTPPGRITFETLPDGKRRANLALECRIYRSDGALAKGASSDFSTPLSADQYEHLLREGIAFRQKLSLAPGDYRLKAGVLDVRTGLFGTVEAPLHLSPASFPR